MRNSYLIEGPKGAVVAVGSSVKIAWRRAVLIVGAESGRKCDTGALLVSGHTCKYAAMTHSAVPGPVPTPIEPVKEN